MRRPLRENLLKEDENRVISDHLRNHVHLTNCIHLKNHLHWHSPNMAERSLMRNLIVLQRSRSLRDPSTSPSSWHSPSVVDSLSKKHEKDGAIQSGRRSVGLEHQRGSTRLSGSSPWHPSLSKAKVTAAEASGEYDDKGRVAESGITVADRESSRKIRKSNLSCSRGKEQANLISEKIDTREKCISEKSSSAINTRHKTLSEQIKEHPNLTDTENINSSHNCSQGDHIGQASVAEDDPQPSSLVHGNGINRVKTRRFKGVRKLRGLTDARDNRALKDFSVASYSLAQGSRHHNFCLGGDEDAEMECTHAPRNGCGIPWNWSRIHHRGKTFLDMAGKSLSCGRGDTMMRKDECPIPESQRDSDIPTVAGLRSCSSTRSDSDALPLLDVPCGSHESAENSFLDHDYSGELGIFADHNEKDSVIASEMPSGHHKSRGHHHGRHRSLTQKYMPRTFSDLVGHNLVVQALSNAVLRRKVGLLYVFYGPHGTGKTSCARIFARALNCHSLDQSKPCGMCTSCISHTLGKSRNVLEVGPAGNFDFESIADVLENTRLPPLSCPYRVFIIDDCDTLPSDSWSAIAKVIDRAPRRVVFLLISTNIDHLPHIIISRCQKFFFPKLKDAEVIYTLQRVAAKEGLEIEKDALKLIASRSDGSLRDAEMTLDQLSLLGQSISVTLVQELVGLVSDEKLVDFLDLALSADTVNTVKGLREIMEAGVEPLALMSQLATMIADILAGSYIFTRERLRRKFFRNQMLTKDEMEKLRQALKTLSEAEKQLRASNAKLTWLTAVLLQLAPDDQYLLPNSSADTSLKNSPMILNYTNERHMLKKNNSKLGLGTGIEGHSTTMAVNDVDKSKVIHSEMPPANPVLSMEANTTNGARKSLKGYMNIENIWAAVIEKIQINALKQFMRKDGKLISVNFGAAPTVQLTFSSHASKSKAEKLRWHIAQAFESVLRTAVTMEIRSETRKDQGSVFEVSHNLPTPENGSLQIIRELEPFPNHWTVGEARTHIQNLSKDSVGKGVGSTPAKWNTSGSQEKCKGEITEILASPQQQAKNQQAIGNSQLVGKGMDSAGTEEASCSHHHATFAPISEKKDDGQQHRRQSLVKGKVSLAHVIQQAEGCTQRSGWSRRKAISIAEKLEHENLRLEPRSRSLLCWKASNITRGKFIHLRLQTRRPQSLLKLVSCGKCSCAKTPR